MEVQEYFETQDDHSGIKEINMIQQILKKVRLKLGVKIVWHSHTSSLEKEGSGTLLSWRAKCVGALLIGVLGLEMETFLGLPQLSLDTHPGTTRTWYIN